MSSLLSLISRFSQMATLAVHEAMGMKVDREAVAGLVSDWSMTACLCEIVIYPFGPLRFYHNCGPCPWDLVSDSRLGANPGIRCSTSRFSLPIVLNVDQFGKFMRSVSA